MVGTKSKWEDELGRWLKPFLDRVRPPESPANTTSLISHRSLLKRYWPKANGKGSVGGGAPKVGLHVSSRPAVSALRMAISTRMLNNRMQCMPGDEVWLVGERRSTGQQKILCVEPAGRCHHQDAR